MLNYHEKNITTGMSYDDVMEKCEEMCGSCSYNDLQYQDFDDYSRCQRISSHGQTPVGD